MKQITTHQEAQMELHIEEYGEFDELEVHLTDQELTFNSYWEGKCEGYHLTMRRGEAPLDDTFFVVEDNTSHPVPGSHNLWLAANGHISWHGVDTPAEIRIPADKMLDAVESLIESERSYLSLPSTTRGRE